MINTRRNRIGVKIVNFIARILLSKKYINTLSFIYNEGMYIVSIKGKHSRSNDIEEIRGTKWGL